VDTCVGGGNHHYFVLFLANAVAGLGLFVYLALSWTQYTAGMNTSTTATAAATDAIATVAAASDDSIAAVATAGAVRWEVLVKTFELNRALGCLVALAAYHTLWISVLLAAQLYFIASDKTTYESIKRRQWIGEAAAARKCLPVQWVQNCAAFWCLSAQARGGQYAPVPFSSARKCCDNDHSHSGHAHAHGSIELA
jgi:DHHC palmitoyltransferase